MGTALQNLSSIISLSNVDSDVIETDNDRVFIKEVVHVGTFHKDDQRIPITEQHLKHWCKTFAEMAREGIEVPVPLEHTRDPEKRRGKVLSLTMSKNSRGLPAMYAKIAFSDAKQAKQLRNSGVSIFVPKEVKTGSGNTYKIPIEHIAITDYPVVAGLEPFKPIALSFTPADDKGDDKKDTKPDGDAKNDGNPSSNPPNKSGDPVRMIANMLGVDPSITDPAQLSAACQQVIQTLMARGGMQPPANQPQRPMTPQAPAPGVQPMMPMMPGGQPQAVAGHQQAQQASRPVGNASGRPLIAASRIAFSLDDLPTEVLMALSKKQMKKIKKAIKKGKVSVTGPTKTNDKSHFGSTEDCGDDTYCDEGNDAFDNGEENEEENEDMFSGKGRGTGLALSGSVLDVVKNGRQVIIDQLFNAGNITAHVKKGMEERFIAAPTVAFSAQYDDGFNAFVKLMQENGRVLPKGKSGPQVAGAVALSHAEGSGGSESNPLVADAERRAKGESNF